MIFRTSHQSQQLAESSLTLSDVLVIYLQPSEFKSVSAFQRAEWLEKEVLTKDSRELDLKSTAREPFSRMIRHSDARKCLK
jgi:hypothetical protein